MSNVSGNVTWIAWEWVDSCTSYGNAMRAFLKNQIGFTLIELLAVMATVATLAGILYVAVTLVLSTSS